MKPASTIPEMSSTAAAPADVKRGSTVTPLRRRSQAERTAAARESIVRATLDVLRDDGLHGFTTGAVAERAGVSKGLVHYHFDSKEQLLMAAQAEMFRSIFESVTAMAARLEPSLDRALWGLDQLWSQLFQSRDTIAVVMQLAAQAAAGGDERQQRRFLAFVGQQETLVTDGMRLVLGPLERTLRVPLDTLARVVMAELIGLGAMLEFRGDPEAVDRAYRAFRELVVFFLPAEFRSLSEEAKP